MPTSNRDRIERRASYSVLSALFVSLFGLYSFYQSRHKSKTEIRPFDLVQLAFASYRLGRMVAYDKIFEGYRSPFAETVPDPTGEGMTTEPKGKGLREAMGELITCPICTGTWISAGLVYILQLFPAAGRTLLAITSAIGMAEFINSATEAFEWLGQAEREEAGSMAIAKRR